MLGWDVSYVWPLLEGVVTSQDPQTSDSWQLVMGNPREADQPAGNTSGETSTQPPHRSFQTPRRLPDPEPPPYETVNTTSSPVRSEGRPVSREPRRNASTGTTILASNLHRNRTQVNTRPRRSEEEVRRLRPQRWPHKASSVFGCLSCVLGLCNVSRFSMLVHIYKGCFIFQFLLLSMVIGIPLLYLQMVLGQYLGAGLLDMWYISPAFKGLGFAMLYLYIIMGVYQAIPLSWLFVYFKDSFITLKDSYKWGKCHYNFARNGCIRALNSSSADFYGWTVPSYFHGRVLGRKPGEFQIGELKFEVAFNLCLVWLIVFVCLSRGPKTFGKVVYVFGMLPIALLMMVTMRMGQQWSDGILDLFSTSWKPVLIDPSSWMLAAREMFITWSLLGTIALHLCSHNKMSTNVTKNVIAIAIMTIVVLVTSAFLFACTANVLRRKNLSLATSSYEDEPSIRVLKPGYHPNENLTVMSLILGESISPKEAATYQSGYQVLRLATEAFPAALAVEGVRNISSFWAICFYTSMILFGLGQQVVIWYCVVESIIAINYKVFKAWQTTLTFITCNLAFLLGLPITSNIGIYIIYFLDFSVGSLWWIVLMYFIMLFAILFIRGRPYGTDQLVTIISQDPNRRSKLLPILTFLWNIILPVSFLVLTICFLRTSSLDPYSPMGELMDNYSYWQPWAKTLNLGVQMFPLVLILTVCAYQAFKVFVAKTGLSLIERIKLLCCPVLPLPSLLSRQSLHSTSSSLSQGSTNSGFVDDPPPKYTPPPSYSTATSRMLAKQMDGHRQSGSCALDLDDELATIEDGILPSRQSSLGSDLTELSRTVEQQRC